MPVRFAGRAVFYLVEMSLLRQVQEAIFAVFSPMVCDEQEFRRALEKHVLLPNDDPGEWAPESFAVIRGEAIGLPGPTVALGQWLEVSDLLIPHGFYVENINEAVAAVYEV